MKYCPQCKQQFSDDQQRFCPRDQARLSLPDPYRLVGSTLENKYQIEALAGIGGFGAVYSAQHLGFEREVAFKILKPDLAVQMPSAVSLFASEAKTVGRLRHENIVEVFDTGRTADGLAYLAMEWLDGAALDEELRAHGPLSVAYTAELLRQIAAALAKAHGQRIIHRDLKPSNVMLVRQPGEPERVKVLDFGIAKVLSADAGSLAVSQVSRPIGTPHYSSPEQWQTKAEIDARSDIYALGVMLYEMLSGTMPFNASSIPELIQLKLNTKPRPLRELRPELPAALDELVRRMFDRDKEQRPRHVSEIPALFAAACQPAEPWREPTIVEPEPPPLTPGRRKTEEYKPTFLREPERKPEPPREPPPEPVKAVAGAGKTTPQKKSKLWLAVGGAVLALGVVIAIGVNGLFESNQTGSEPIRPAGFASSAGTTFSFETATVDANGKATKRAGQARQVVEDLGNGVKLELVEIPAGEFQMGEDATGAAESEHECGRYFSDKAKCKEWANWATPRHRVQLKGFTVGKYEVTQAQWRVVAGFPKVKLDLNADPARFKGAALPVEQVSWDEAVEFCARLSRKTGKTYRLPSEAEWEYAARAGTTTPFAFGPTITPGIVNYDGNYPHGSAPKGRYREQTIPVGSLGVANAWGLFDMHGNVWEWCEDDWHDSYNGAPTDGRAWADISAHGSPRVNRGGGWSGIAVYCRSALRYRDAPGSRNVNVGFRLVRT